MNRMRWLTLALLVAGGAYIWSRTKMGNAMLAKLTDKIAALIFAEEGLRLDAYQDTGGAWTIGYGHKIVPADGIYPFGPVRSISKDVAIIMRNADIEKAVAAVTNHVRVPLNQNQLAALTSLAYNIGGNAFATSTLVKKLNAKDPDAASVEFPRWNKDNGRIDPVLTARRARELKLFNARSA